jgi:hypothetical protein
MKGLTPSPTGGPTCGDCENFTANEYEPTTGSCVIFNLGVGGLATLSVASSICNQFQKKGENK